MFSWRPDLLKPFFCRVRDMKVICAVYGPHAQTGRDTAFSEEGQLQCEFSYAPFATPGGRRESKGGKKDDERELSTLLRQTLESSVQVSNCCRTRRQTEQRLSYPGKRRDAHRDTAGLRPALLCLDVSLHTHI